MRLHFHILHLNVHWFVRGSLMRLRTAASMVFANERRTYITYSTGELITVTGWNYLSLMKIDAGETAVLNTGGGKWSKCYLF